MTRGTIKTKDYYVACRRDKGVVDSIVDTAKYKGMSTEEVKTHLGLWDFSEDMQRQLEGAAHRAGIK